MKKTKATAFSKLLAKAVKIEGKKSVMKMGDARELFAVLRKLCIEDQNNVLTVVGYLGGYKKLFQ